MYNASVFIIASLIIAAVYVPTFYLFFVALDNKKALRLKCFHNAISNIYDKAASLGPLRTIGAITADAFVL